MDLAPNETVSSQFNVTIEAKVSFQDLKKQYLRVNLIFGSVCVGVLLSIVIGLMLYHYFRHRGSSVRRERNPDRLLS